MRISDWSSDVCSSDLAGTRAPALPDCPLATGGRKPDMHVVIFEVRPKPGRKGDYLDIAAALRPELEQIDGFISIERFASLTDEGKVLSLSFRRDEAAVVRWPLHADHPAAPARPAEPAGGKGGG